MPLDLPKSNVHTIFFQQDPTLVQHLTKLSIDDDQIMGRSLIKAFAITGAYAKQKYGEDVTTLPDPVCVQCVQTDGQWFHFTAFQLNTLDVNSTNDKRNYWWSLPRISLYDFAGFDRAIPSLDNYNPEVFKNVLAFYKNA